MTIKRIRWFEMTEGVPGAFYNRDPKTCVVCLNYKDYNNRSEGLAPWFLTHELVVPTLINEWGPDGYFEALERGAQKMVDYAGSNDAIGFKEGEFYGEFWIRHEVGRSPEVLIGLTYANSATPLSPVQGVVERVYRESETHRWVTPFFAIPLQFEVQLRGEASKVSHRVSRYKRTPVI